MTATLAVNLASGGVAGSSATTEAADAVAAAARTGPSRAGRVKRHIRQVVCVPKSQQTFCARPSFARGLSEYALLPAWSSFWLHH